MGTFGKGGIHRSHSASRTDDYVLQTIWEFFPFVFRINDNLSPNKSTLTILEKVCRERGWKEYGEGDSKICGGNVLGWNLWWRSVVMMNTQTRSLYSWQYTNHIPKAINFCNKEYLASYIKIMEDHFGDIFNFCPKTFTLPKELEELENEHHARSNMDLVDKVMNQARNLIRCGQGDNLENGTRSETAELNLQRQDPEKSPEKNYNAVWICKPVGKSQGKGIVIIDNLTNLPDHPVTVVQEYISKPLLICGYKFDLRLYVTIVSVNPLTIYAYREGLTRFATEPYDLSDLEKSFSHLTNASLNKLSPGYGVDKEGVGQGCKWTLSKLRQYFRETGRPDWFLWQKIMSIIVLTILGETIQQVGFFSSRNNFEFLGYDILIDRNMRAWLLETNISPGLGGDCDVDEAVKVPMLHELFDLLGLPDARPFVGTIPSVTQKSTKSDDVLPTTVPKDINGQNGTLTPDQSPDSQSTSSPESSETGEGAKTNENPLKIWDKNIDPESEVQQTSSEFLEDALEKSKDRQLMKLNGKVKLAGSGRISSSLQKRLLDVTAIYGTRVKKAPKLMVKAEGEKPLSPKALITEFSDITDFQSPEVMAKLNFLAATDWQGACLDGSTGGTVGPANSTIPHRPGVGLKKRSWQEPPARHGNWIRIFPFDMLSYQMTRGQLSLDMKVLVCQMEKFLQLAETLCLNNPHKSDEFYGRRVREELVWNKLLWHPPAHS